MPKQADSNKLSIAGIALSHPDKVLWPAAKPDGAFTKLDLAQHYQAFADRILLHVAGRPVSLVRAPDGALCGDRRFGGARQPCAGRRS